jgi:hypothetical protein
VSLIKLYKVNPHPQIDDERGALRGADSISIAPGHHRQRKKKNG